ncbi:MAG: carbamate kinase, partial [Anaerolineales bacterium]|nr:carbamate kinase [Anaerolineales bacterium]
RAVIDKDRATSLLAVELGVDLFLISTAVAQVAINFNQPDQKWLGEMTADEARKYQAEGHFKPGSMGPKIEAVLSYLDAFPQGTALITDPPNIAQALDGKTGTWMKA